MMKRHFPDNLTDAERRMYRRWSRGIFLLYSLALLAVAGLALQGQADSLIASMKGKPAAEAKAALLQQTPSNE